MNATVVVMALARTVFGALCLIGAVLMWNRNDIAFALRINGFLGSIGPIVLLGVTALGISQLRFSYSPVKLSAILAGVIMVFFGTR